MKMNIVPVGVGVLIREWRQRRRMSQLDLALEVDVSQRHLSFIESGRAKPSREMVIRLTEQLGVPLRHRNQVLAAAGFAPIFSERSLDDPALKPALKAVEMVLKAHEPYPAIAVDKAWNMVLSNNSVAWLLKGVKDEKLLTPPVNVLRLSLHPKGLAPHILNYSEWRRHLLERLRFQIDNTADPALKTLESELRAYPDGESPINRNEDTTVGIAVPLRLSIESQQLSFISTITVFGTPLDVTLSELAVEAFFPGDKETEIALRSLVDAGFQNSG